MDGLTPLAAWSVLRPPSPCFTPVAALSFLSPPLPSVCLCLWFWAGIPLLLATSYLFWRGENMAGRTALAATTFFFAGGTLITALSSTSSSSDATTSFRPIFTVPAAVDNSVPLIPNINDPQAVNPQDVCPGYTASNVRKTSHGLTADLNLAGNACNVYGTDVDALSLTVEYQSSDRLHVEIPPTYVDSSNTSWFVLPEALIPKPGIDCGESAALDNDLNFVWSNDPTFSFQVIRQSTGDVLFSTTGTQLVYENQFIEFGSALPENYNLYGLGEVIHGLRMGNNFTRTFWAADAGR